MSQAERVHREEPTGVRHEMNSVVAAGGGPDAKPASSLAASRTDTRGAMMRVWLVDDRVGEDADGLEALLTQLAARPGSGLSLLATRAVWPELAAELRSLRPDVLVVREASWLDGPWTHEVLGFGPALLIVASPEVCERFRPVAEQHPVSFLAPRPSLDGLWLALTSAMANQRREAGYRTQVARLQQRLNDRIIIERAKGILVQRLGLSEEDAYKRLRMLSRRQRRQIRDIAQSLLDTQSLLMPGGNGFLDYSDVAAAGDQGKAPAQL